MRSIQEQGHSAQSLQSEAAASFEVSDQSDQVDSSSQTSISEPERGELIYLVFSDGSVVTVNSRFEQE